jgi:hypothetical protein
LTNANDSPHLSQCVGCTNGKPENGLIVDAGPSLMYCNCNPGTGAAQSNWPTAIFDLSQCPSLHSVVMFLY